MVSKGDWSYYEERSSVADSRRLSLVVDANDGDGNGPSDDLWQRRRGEELEQCLHRRL